MSIRLDPSAARSVLRQRANTGGGTLSGGQQVLSSPMYRMLTGRSGQWSKPFANSCALAAPGYGSCILIRSKAAPRDVDLRVHRSGVTDADDYRESLEYRCKLCCVAGRIEILAP